MFTLIVKQGKMKFKIDKDKNKNESMWKFEHVNHFRKYKNQQEEECYYKNITF